MTSFRLAIFECDTPLHVVKEQCGTYGDIFTKLLSTGLLDLESHNPQTLLEIRKCNVVSERSYPDLSDIDGLLLTGSKHDSFADTPWILHLVTYVQTAFRARKPVVGICFGHQIIARAMGASVGRSENGWEISVDMINLNSEGSELFGHRDTLMLHQMHRDVVHSVPQGFVNIGSSPRCNVQGLYLPKRVLTLQAHPEFDAFIMRSLLERRHNDRVFDDEMHSDGMMRADSGHDGLVVAKAILRLFLESK